MFRNSWGYQWGGPPPGEDHPGDGFWDVRATDVLETFGGAWDAYWRAQSEDPAYYTQGRSSSGPGIEAVVVLLLVAALLYVLLRG